MQAETIDERSELAKRHPWVGVALCLCSAAIIVGFLGNSLLTHYGLAWEHVPLFILYGALVAYERIQAVPEHTWGLFAILAVVILSGWRKA